MSTNLVTMKMSELISARDTPLIHVLSKVALNEQCYVNVTHAFDVNHNKETHSLFQSMDQQLKG